MKRAALIVIMLSAVSLIAAQDKAQPATSQAAATTAPPPGKRPPQAKTQPEFDAFNAAINSRTDAAAMEKAADDFAAKFPASELRVLLYQTARRVYQSANNPDKEYEMAQKELKLDPDSPEALIGAAEVIAEKTRDTDLDKDQRWAEAQKDAQRALETVDTDVAIPAGVTQDKIDAYKKYLRSSAYSILGAISSNQEKF